MYRILFSLLGLVLLAGPAFAAETRIQMPVIDGNVLVTNVYVLSRDGSDPQWIEADSIRPWLRETLSLTAQEKLETLVDAQGRVVIDATEAAGFTLTFDPENAVLKVAMLPNVLKTSRLSLQNDVASASQTPLQPADLSGFMNFRGGMDYVYESDMIDGRQPMRLDIDGALNHKGWVVEGRSDYIEDDPNYAWQRDEFRLVRDWPDKMVRFAAGDLSYPVSGFQSFAPMLGVSLARNFSLQPYRVTKPTGQSSFTLQSPSRVDVMINDQRVRSLQLQPGPYDISDFPVTDGANDVTLVITDAAGNVEEKTFPLLSDQELLAAGLHEYTYNLGIRSENQNREITYDDIPVFSAFHRYGFTETLTAGASLQADEDVQQAGVSVVDGHTWGTLGLESSVSNADIGVDAATQVSYRYIDPETQKNVAFSAEYRGADFAALGQDMPSNPTSWELAARYTMPLPKDVTMGVGGRYQFSRVFSTADDWSYSMNFSKTIYDTISANVNVQHDSDDGAGVFMALTWTPAASRHTVSTSVDTVTQTRDVNWSWRDDRRWQLGAGVTQQDDMLHHNVNAAYTGYRGEASLREDSTTSVTRLDTGQRQNMSDRRLRVQMGTAIAFADDHVALARPINNGFVILTKHDNLKGRNIGINPEEEAETGKKAYQARIDTLGPGVISDAVPYIYRPVKVDTQDLPDGYDIGSDNFVAMPSYKSGTVAVVGNAANVYADGFLVFADGAPVKLKAGIIQSTNDDKFEAQEFFTNQKGRFRISRLMPGTYKISLYDHPDLPIILRIPDDIPPGRYAAGNLVVEGPSS